ncbi:MAG: hypothetical protein JXJ20_11780 [Anaerolineae bacterium]|nr:hypothetical protein [Anaerolineae bacterium]
MNKSIDTFARLAGIALLVLALAIFLAACGDDDDEGDDTTQPSAAATDAETDAATDEPGETPGELPPDMLEDTDVPPPTAEPNYTLTPALSTGSTLLEQAATIASADLAARLNIRLDQVQVLDPETALSLRDPLLCPEITEPNVTPYYVYLQFERFIYPYQFYESADAVEPVVGACDDTLVDEEVLYIPTPDARMLVIELVKNDLDGQGVDPEPGEYEVTPMTWTDDALGCIGEPGQEKTPVLTEGYLITYTLDGVTYEYHTDKDGARIEYCEPPVGYASTEAFIFTLNKAEIYDVRRIEDAVARYDGLDAEGELIELGTGGWRVGVFDFDTQEEARQAAGQIDDDRVAHIFVSGYVLIVQEDSNPEAYSILRTHADLVRSPILERQGEQVPVDAEPGEQPDIEDDPGDNPFPTPSDLD